MKVTKAVIFFVLAVVLLFLSVQAQAEDFPDSQVLNILGEIEALNKQIMDLDARANTAVKRWQALGKTPAEVMSLTAVAGSTYKNMPAADLSNVLGSLEAFRSGAQNGFMATHDDNFVKLLK